MKISVIIPIYNSEKYLSFCIESILNQTYQNLEVILINDGSTDKSLNICKKYAKKDSRILVFDKINSGVSSTRNFGLKKASGNYVMFVDSDDFLANNYIELMLYEAENNDCDVVISGLTYCDESGKEIKKDLFMTHNNKISFYMIENSFFGSTYFCSACKTLINKKIINKYKLKFNENLKFGEDYLFSYNLLNSTDKIYYISDVGYYYRQNNNSSTHNNSIEIIYEYLKNNIYIFDIFLGISKNKKLINSRLLMKYNISLRKVSAVEGMNYKNFKIHKKQMMKIVDYHNRIKFLNFTIIKNDSIINKMFFIMLYLHLDYLYYLSCVFIKKIKKR